MPDRALGAFQKVNRPPERFPAPVQQSTANMNFTLCFAARMFSKVIHINGTTAVAKVNCVNIKVAACSIQACLYAGKHFPCSELGLDNINGSTLTGSSTNIVKVDTLAAEELNLHKVDYGALRSVQFSQSAMEAL